MAHHVALVSTYDLGRQPVGLASPAAVLRAAGADVHVLDVSVDPLDETAIRDAAVVAFFVPMHTAARLTQGLISKVRDLEPRAHLCAYGLYAPLNEHHFRRLGVETILGGEYETGLLELYQRLIAEPRPRRTVAIPVISLDHQSLHTPDRTGLPPLERYAFLRLPGGAQRIVGYTEASRGCRHRCRHCPVVPIYDGHFIPVPATVVIEDIRQQVAAGARHITFGDPDFFNGPAHSRRIVHLLHEQFPAVTYDVTIKVEHLCQYEALLTELAATGCVLVTSAVESFDAVILERFEKQHTAEDFEHALAACRRAGLAFNSTFVAFTPWTTIDGYRAFLDRVAHLGLVGNVAPVQYAIRLLVTASSRLLELPDVVELLQPFDEAALFYPWRHPDPAVDELYEEVMAVVAHAESTGLSRREIYRQVRSVAGAGAVDLSDDQEIPSLSEPWYCCAEPTSEQLARL
ncbi:MAG: CUAEP/CCAEP-tail radical SAM protein [Ilumatobacteraceae bacterium]